MITFWDENWIIISAGVLTLLVIILGRVFASLISFWSCSIVCSGLTNNKAIIPPPSFNLTHSTNEHGQKMHQSKKAQTRHACHTHSQNPTYITYLSISAREIAEHGSDFLNNMLNDEQKILPLLEKVPSNLCCRTK